MREEEKVRRWTSNHTIRNGLSHTCIPRQQRPCVPYPPSALFTAAVNVEGMALSCMSQAGILALRNSMPFFTAFTRGHCIRLVSCFLIPILPCRLHTRLGSTHIIVVSQHPALSTPSASHQVFALLRPPPSLPTFAAHIWKHLRQTFTAFFRSSQPPSSHLPDMAATDLPESPLPDDTPSPATTTINIDAFSPSIPNSSSPSQPFSPRLKPHNLVHLPDDVLRRIITRLTHNALRGTPYYPSKTFTHVLPLASTCTTLQAAVSNNVTSDHAWCELTDTDVCEDGRLSIPFTQQLLQWYRIAGPNLTDMHIHTKLASYQHLRLRVLRTVLDSRPRLRFLDLVGFHEFAHLQSQLLSALTQLLRISRHSLTHLNVALSPGPLLDIICEADLLAVTNVDLRSGFHTEAGHFLYFLRSLHSPGAVGVRQITLRCFTQLPQELHPGGFVAAAPHLTAIEYFETASVNNPCHFLSPNFVQLATSYSQLRSLHVQTMFIEKDQLRELLRKCEMLDDIAFTKCAQEGMLEVVAEMGKGHAIRKLELTQKLRTREVSRLGSVCTGLRELSFICSPESVQNLPECMAHLPHLQSLTLNAVVTAESRSRCETAIIEALQRSGGDFHRFVLHGVTLSVVGIATIMKSLGERLEYLVTGIFTERMSRSRCIIDLLRVTTKRNPNMKVLCFGLGLQYDRRAADVHDRLISTIEEAGRKLPHLDTIWLMRNVESIKALEKPEEDLVDYESDDSLAEESL